MNGESMVKTTWIGDVQKGQYNDKEVELKGWVKRERGSNKLRFIVLRDSTGSIQCVGKWDVLGDETFAELKAILIETSVVFQGKVKRFPRAARSRTPRGNHIGPVRVVRRPCATVERVGPVVLHRFNLLPARSSPTPSKASSSSRSLCRRGLNTYPRSIVIPSSL